ncbi:MAG: translation initiation factor IF-2 [Eubacteriales bacterium]|nr:translation initiation factor IF-2 [Eubacteriales bacterium]
MSNDNNEKNINRAGETDKQAGGAVHKKKVSVVFRSQNSQNIKDLPKNLRNGQKNKQQKNTQPQQKGPRPLPAGTKPVRPAVFGETKVQKQSVSGAQNEVKNEQKNAELNANAATELKNEAPKAETVKADVVKQETAKPAETNTVSEPAANAVTDGLPQIKIVKSYANYDAAAVIAKATASAKAQNNNRDSQSGRRDNNRRDGQGTGQRRDNRDGRNNGQNNTQRREGGFRDNRRNNFDGGDKDKDMNQQSRQGQYGRRDKDSQSGRSQQAQFDAPQGKTVSSRKNNQHKNTDRYDKRDKYRDDIEPQKANKTGKGAFIKPEPKQEKPEDDIKVIVIPESLTIKDLAEKLKMQPSVIIKKLFLQGQMVTPNTDLSYEEAEEIAMEYDILCEKEEKVDVIAELLKEDEEDESKMIPRSPVVCVMGHVDHGKTSLLDAIRNTNVTSREAGGITQHIGASVVRVGDRKLTFLDTPGHEAFTAMRLRGAQSTDIAVLVVAADDGVKPQTVEAINHAKAAGVEVVVAINKMDKPTANPDLVKKELTEYGLIAEEWGGSTPMVPISAKTGAGITDLLEIILLEADVLELKANPNRTARGIVIEAQLDKGRGPVATVLVQKGTLKIGNNIAAGACYGKVRAMIDDKGNRVKKAGPSTPVEILGLNDVPNAGEIFMGCEDEKEARNIAETFIAEHKNKMLEETKQKMNLDDLFDEIKAGNIKELPIIIKADVQGSVEAVKQSLGKLSNEEVAVKVIHSGVGNINESDVNLASAGNAIIIGFNVKPDPTAKSKAEQEKVDIRLYKVIYQAIEDLEAALTGMLAPEYEEKNTGKAIVRQIFKASGVGNIAGCYVTDGIIERGSKARVYHGEKMIFDGNIASLKRFKDEVKEVKTGFECGIVFEDFGDIAEDDYIEIYKMVEVPRSIKKSE